MSKFNSRILLAAFVVCLASCGSLGKKEEPLEDAATMYKNAKELSTAGSYDSAIKAYEQLEARYPYGVYAQQAQLDVAYAYYQTRDQGSAVAACDRFIKLYPNHPKVDYAYYLKGLSLMGSGGMDAFTSAITPLQPLAERDPKTLEEAFDVFRHLVTQYPNSQYAEDSRKQIKELVDALAAHELVAARYYMKRRAPLAAINRAQRVIKTFPESSSVEEALGIMIDGYTRLQQPDLREDTARILKQSFPNSAYLPKSSK